MPFRLMKVGQFMLREQRHAPQAPSRTNLKHHIFGWDNSLHQITIPGTNVEACRGVGVGDLLPILVHVHCWDQSGQRAVIVVPSTPRRNIHLKRKVNIRCLASGSWSEMRSNLIVGLAALLRTFSRCELLDREVMESSTLGGLARPNNPFELAFLIRRALLLHKQITLQSRTGSVHC